ncbi:MarR family transcriptional regulator [Spongiactinospora rosea]|uniref:MarR family transcriptional regulator n=1 Tax=Spongiactinospora rosea TaxID=2248750 RepID=A0A366M0H4_9ACTN|nr:MarR family winged helix-turn-helix transcriptional regulator [Spongiactinospora rosea]RBQ19728.1 MarR family transcriptional regulator [Spongiactinospora rosea]
MASDESPPPTLVALSAYLLSKVGKTARGRIAERLARRGLRLWDMAVLASLADFGPHAQRDLAHRLDIDTSDMAKVVDRLAGSGHVERSRSPADRRRVSVAITGAGRALLAELEAETRAVQDALLAPLAPAERDQLQALLRRVFTAAADSPS